MKISWCLSKLILFVLFVDLINGQENNAGQYLVSDKIKNFERTLFKSLEIGAGIYDVTGQVAESK